MRLQARVGTLSSNTYPLTRLEPTLNYRSHVHVETLQKTNTTDTCICREVQTSTLDSLSMLLTREEEEFMFV